jgi:alpha-tubulin suppressor-like RCC1 family protein
VAWCWGDDNSGQLGDNNATTFTSYQPLMVAGGHAFKAITAGGSHTCALDTPGKAWCWGDDQYGQVGDGDADQSDKYAPVPVAGNHTFATISASWATTCAVDIADQAWCWGNNATGQLGNGDAGHTPRYEPVAVAGGHSFATISTGWDRTCALDPTGKAWCWGQDTFDQTGGSALTATVAPATVRNEPVAVAGGRTFATLAAGGYQVCAVDTAGKAWCWGENQNGQLGAGDTAGTDTLDPVPVAGDHALATVTAGGHHSCAIDTNGYAWCWGWYYQGRLGLGEHVKQDQFGPAAVAGGHQFHKP